MTYRDVEAIGFLPLDESLITGFIGLLDGLDLPKTHDLGQGMAEDNAAYNKYIVHDDIFTRIFIDEADYRMFLRDVIHTFTLPTSRDPSTRLLTHRLVGAVHAFLTEYYQRFFLLRVSVSITGPGAFMHYHRDLAGEHADRFLVDISPPEADNFGIEVEERLYPLERLAVYKLDTTRLHRAANYGATHRKISLIIQGIADLHQFTEYQRKHLDAFFDVRERPGGRLP